MWIILIGLLAFALYSLAGALFAALSACITFILIPFALFGKKDNAEKEREKRNAEIIKASIAQSKSFRELEERINYQNEKLEAEEYEHLYFDLDKEDVDENGIPYL